MPMVRVSNGGTGTDAGKLSGRTSYTVSLGYQPKRLYMFTEYANNIYPLGRAHAAIIIDTVDVSASLGVYMYEYESGSSYNTITTFTIGGIIPIATNTTLTLTASGFTLTNAPSDRIFHYIASKA